MQLTSRCRRGCKAQSAPLSRPGMPGGSYARLDLQIDRRVRLLHVKQCILAVERRMSSSSSRLTSKMNESMA